jgi:hypothetical protein
MKMIISVISLLFLTAFITGCTSHTTEPLTDTEPSIIGEWESYDIVITSDGVKVDGTTIKVIFNEDSTFEWFVYEIRDGNMGLENHVTGIFNLNDDRIELIDDNGNEVLTGKITKIDNLTFTLKDSFGITAKFNRIKKEN